MIRTYPCFTWFWKLCGLFGLWSWSVSCDKNVLLSQYFSWNIFQYKFVFLCSDEVIDETYGVAVQFDEEEEEVLYFPVY